MGFVFEDRVATYPNRYKVTPTSGGAPYYVVLERADDPTVVGTPLNAETFNNMLVDIAGKVTLPIPKQNLNYKLTESGYYLIRTFTDFFGIIYWESGKEVYASSVANFDDSGGWSNLALRVDAEGNIRLAYRYEYNGTTTINPDVTNQYSIYTARIINTYELPTAEGVSF